METHSLLDGAEHDQVVFCRDRTTGLSAVIAMHDMSHGIAMGGTRMRPYKSVIDASKDAMALSRHMSLKARCAKLPIGGAKGVIIGDPRLKSKSLLASYARFVDRLNGAFVTGQDMNLTREDVEFLRSRTPFIAGDLPTTAGPTLMTALGVFASIKAALAHRFGSDQISGRTIAVLGVGATGQEICRLVHLAGGRLVVADLSPERASHMAELYDAEVVDVPTILRRNVDVLAPCGAGQVIGAELIGQLGAAIIAGSANNQLIDEDGDAELLRLRGIVYCPDFVVNAGGLIEVYHERVGYDLGAVQDKVHQIGGTLTDMLCLADREGVSTLVAAKRYAAAQNLQSIAAPWNPDASAKSSTVSPRLMTDSLRT